MKSIYINLVCSCYIFKNISDTARKYLIENGEICAFQKGETIYSRESYKKSLGIVLEGRAVTQKSVFLMSTLNCGDIFGAAAVFNDSGFVADITASEKCTVFFVSQDVLSYIFAMDKNVAENYMRFLSGRIMFLNKKIDSLTSGSAESRIASFLLENAETDGKIRLLFNLTRLSEFLNLGRASLYRVLGIFEQKGFIRKDGRRIFITDKESLKKLI